MFIAKLIPSRIFSLQARRPSGIIGRFLMSKIFNNGNADLNSFVKDVIDLSKEDQVLEIGFGPGKLIYEMAENVTDGVVTGIDFSEVMLGIASKLNQQYISTGTVILRKGDCCSLPFDGESFDKLCTVNTLYFWEDPGKNLAEMFRVLKPKGKIVIGFRDHKQMSNLNLKEDVFSYYSQQDVVEMLAKAGFANAHIKEKEGRPFVSYCAVANKV